MQVSRIRTAPFRRNEVKQRIELRMALKESLRRISLSPSNDKITSDQINQLVEKIRSL
ncbi:MAG: hypothetical protein PVI78_02130 [Anaerolineales bacterium]|jgi:hypothetical protein